MQKSLERKSGFAYETIYTNPLIRKIIHTDERSEDYATYSSIGNKCAFFLAMIIVGVALMAGLQMIAPETFVLDDGYSITVSTLGLIVLIPMLIIFILTPFIAMLIKRTIPVTGALYCISVGYCISMVSLIIPGYREAVNLAMIITIVIVGVMALVYAKGWIKVDEKFRSIVKILFFTSIATSLLLIVAYFIPQTRSIATFIMENPILSIGGSIVYIVIASLFLLVDFNAIQSAVENHIPRTYEWIAAFGLTFSVIWLFLKVLDLILKLVGKNSSSD